MPFSWYSLKIKVADNEPIQKYAEYQYVIFNGYFKVDDNTALVTEVYETVNGSTDINKNILIPTGSLGVVYDEYLGFTVYDAVGFAVYDNVYVPGWNQFDNNGLILNNMSSYPQYDRFNLCAGDLGEESSTNVGKVLITDKNNNKVPLKTSFEISPLTVSPTFSVPTGNPSWYKINITNNLSSSIFNGYFYVNQNNILVAMFETIKGRTNFKENLLIRKYPGMYWFGKTITGFNILANPYKFTNAYVPGWKQFDFSGVALSKMSYFPHYHSVNFWCANMGDETITNRGGIIVEKVIVTDYSQTDPNYLQWYEFLDVSYHISPCGNPMDQLFSKRRYGKMHNKPNRHEKRNVRI